MSLDDALAVTAAGLSAVSALVAALGARWSWRADRRATAAEGLAVRKAAVADLADTLHGVRRLAKQADVTAVRADEVAAVMVDFEDRAHRYQAVLPVHLRAVGREVRAAMGNCFGAPAWAGLDARSASGELATFNHYWWELTRSYLEHVDACLQDWRLAPAGWRPARLTYFHAWRRDQDAVYFASGDVQEHPSV